MRRRTVLVGTGALVAGSGALMSSAAFGTSSAYGTVDVDVSEEAVAIYNSHDDAENDENRTTEPKVSGDLEEARTNVQKDAFAFRHTGSSSDEDYNVSVTFIDEGGAPIKDLENALGNDIIDFRLLATGQGESKSPQFIDTSDEKMRDSMKDENGDSLDDNEYLDQNERARTSVPEIGKVKGRGAVQLSSSGQTLQVGAVVSVAQDASDTSLPGFRVDIEPA